MNIQKIGFEFEVIVRQKDFLNVWDYLYQYSRHIKLGGDTSLKYRNGWKDLEIKTSPLDEDASFDLFYSLLDVLTGFNYGGIIETNYSCGLHINVSTNDLGHTYREIVERYNDKKYLRLWDRENNPACVPIDFREFPHRYCNDPYEYMLINRGDKHRSVALRNAENNNGARIENRIIGGKDYILRKNDLDTTISDFITFIHES